MKSIKLNSNSYNGLFLLAFSLFFIIVTPSQVPFYEGSDALSPRLVPYVVLILVSIVGVILVVRPHKDDKKAEEIAEELAIKESDNVVEGERSLGDLAIFVGICIFIVLFAEIIGFTFAAIICLIVALKVFRVKQLYMVLLVGIALPLLIDIGFRFLQIYLPLGFWANILY